MHSKAAHSRDARAAGVSGKRTNGAAGIERFVKAAASRESRVFSFFPFPPPLDVFDHFQGVVLFLGP